MCILQLGVFAGQCNSRELQVDAAWFPPKDIFNSFIIPGVAQLAECLIRDQGAANSSLATLTNYIYREEE